LGFLGRGQEAGSRRLLQIRISIKIKPSSIEEGFLFYRYSLKNPQSYSLPASCFLL